MTDKEILVKAIKKAEKNEYKSSIDLEDGYYVEKFIIHNNGDYEGYYDYSVRDIIFSHDFAKAFWGEKSYCTYYSLDKKIESDLKIWEYNLQQMVLEENPLKYLEKFLDE